MIILVAAAGLNNELGKDDGVPLWNLPDEYARFREQIKFHPIIMGRKSFDVIKEPLKDSLNIVVTRNKSYNGHGALVVHSLAAAVEKARSGGKGKDIYIVGCGILFEEAIKIADKMELSRINGTFPNAEAFSQSFQRMTGNRSLRNFTKKITNMPIHLLMKPDSGRILVHRLIF